jgi:hypothetical protein
VRIVHSAQCGGITEAKFLVPDWQRNVVPARQATVHRLAGLYDNSMPESAISGSQGLRIWLLEIHAPKNWFSMEKNNRKRPMLRSP